MPWTWPPFGSLGQTCTKPFDQHVLELSTAALRPPSTIPSLLAHSTARSRWSSAGHLTVEHPTGVHCTATTPSVQHVPEPPDRRSKHHSTPRTPLARPSASLDRTSPPLHVPAPPAAWPRHSRAGHQLELPRLFKRHPGPLPGTTHLHHPLSLT